MPVIKINRVYSVSSEDPASPASNLLSENHNKKWKTKTAGEESASVIFQLPTSLIISGIDVGNENSAFFEVLVGKNGAQSDEDFKQILLSSSLMSVTECRTQTTPNRVRCFGKSALIEEVAKQKWELVKVICTQPFNKNLKYGLSFIKFYTPTFEENDEQISSENEQTTPARISNSSNPFIKLKMREKSPESDNETSGSLFVRWKQAKVKSEAENVPSISTASAIRNASHSPNIFNKAAPIFTTKPPQFPNTNNGNESDDSDKPNEKTKNRNRVDLLYNEEDKKPNDKLEKKINRDREHNREVEKEKKSTDDKIKSEKIKKITDSASKFRNFIDDADVPQSSGLSQQRNANTNQSKLKKNQSTGQKNHNSSQRSPSKSAKRQSSPISIPQVKTSKKIRREIKYKPFHKLLEGVVIAISGIQNPIRAEIRQKGLELGGKYKPDWDDSCTHLICAFKNTPKYNQVKGHGKIVSKEWITTCHLKKRKIPWREFALDSDDENKENSEEEILDESMRQSQSSSDSNIDEDKNEMLPIKKIPRPDTMSDIDLNDHQSMSGSDSDTEDEIERILLKKKAQLEESKNVKHKDIYDETTDEDIRTAGSSNGEEFTPLPDFYHGKVFYIADNISSVDEIKLRRYITVYQGTITNSASSADYIISNGNFSTASSFKGEIVQPLWIFECNALGCFLPTNRYLIQL